MLNHSRPTWTEVSLAALRKNFRTLQQHVGPEVGICAVVKAHAYGHGAIECARTLEQEGARWFGVATAEEGVWLRDSGVRGRILVMTGIWRDEAREIVRHKLTPAVCELSQVEALEKAAALKETSLPVHLKIDTGMSRLGVLPSELPELVKRLAGASHLQVEGIFTHLASSEEVGAAQNEDQLQKFRQAIAELRNSGIKGCYGHLANTAAIFAYPKWLNCSGFEKMLVRPGLALYGYCLPFPASQNSPVVPALEPVLSWKSRIIALRNLEPGERVGYGGTWTTPRRSRIATIPVGYADGLSRQLSSRGQVIVRGSYAPMVGRISMDLTSIDVTDIEGVMIGDEVVIIGSQGNLRIGADTMAAIAGTVPYEVLCNIGKRVPRKYYE